MRRGAAAFRCAVAEMQGWRIGHEADEKAIENIDMTRPRAEVLVDMTGHFLLHIAVIFGFLILGLEK